MKLVTAGLASGLLVGTAIAESTQAVAKRFSRWADRAAADGFNDVSQAYNMASVKMEETGTHPKFFEDLKYGDSLLDGSIWDHEAFDDYRKVNCDSGKECNVPLTLQGIYHYGCWCNFGKDIGEGKGQPMSAHDEMCQKMQHCIRCAKMDSQDGGYDCDIQTVSYNAVFNMANKKLAVACGKQNGNDDCAAHMCTCELQMISDLLELVWTGYSYEPEFAHPKIGGNFDADSNCIPVATGPTSETECCGKYPSRYPYSLGGNKDCCQDTGDLFNELSHHCCASGVTEIGEPC